MTMTTKLDGLPLAEAVAKFSDRELWEQLEELGGALLGCVLLALTMANAGGPYWSEGLGGHRWLKLERTGSKHHKGVRERKLLYVIHRYSGK